MKRMLLLLALCLCLPAAVQAQDDVNQLLKAVKEQTALADKNPQDGLKQLQAARILINEKLGDQRDPDRAMVYANKALEIAMQQTELKDTLLGNTCGLIGLLYLKQENDAYAFDYFDMAMDAYERELGKYNPLTISNRLSFAHTMIGVDPRRGFIQIQKAFYDNEQAPASMRVENLNLATLDLVMAMEYLIADYTLRTRRALLLISFEGERYFILQLDEWQIGQPLVEWLAPALVRSQLNDTSGKKRDLILMNDATGEFRRIAADEENRPQMVFNFRTLPKDPRHMEFGQDNTVLVTFQDEQYNELLERFNAFMAQ